MSDPIIDLDKIESLAKEASEWFAKMRPLTAADNGALVSVAPDVLLSLVGEVRRLRAEIAKAPTHCRGDLCAGSTTCPATEDGYCCTREKNHAPPHIACMGGQLASGHNLVIWEG